MLSSLLLSVLVGAGLAAPHRADLSSIRRFEANAGQWSRDIRFLARTPHGLLALGDRDARLRLDGGRAVVRLSWDGAARAVETFDVLPGVSHYLVGTDQSRWRSAVHGYRRVRYAEVAPNVDLGFYGARDGFEYDVIVRPGGDPSSLALRFDGVTDVRVDADGGIVLDTSGGVVRQHAPVAYQERDGIRTRVGVRYEIRDGRITLHTDPYDRSRLLVIDPTVDFSTYLGGGAADDAAAVATDAAGNIYVTGTTTSPDFPASSPMSWSGAHDAFIVKLSPDGSTLVYATYLGGTLEDYARGVAVSPAGSAYVTGITSSPDFPIVNAAQAWQGGTDAFVARLSADGSALVFSTYLGGSGNDDGHGIAIDVSGAAYVTGPTRSTTFPLLNAFRNTPGGSFITKLSSTGSLVYSTFFGDPGTSSKPNDRVSLHAIAVDVSGAAYVGGDSQGALSETTPGAYRTTLGNANCLAIISPGMSFQPCYDGVVAKLTPSGSLAYGTYLRGDSEPPFSNDLVGGIAVDAGGSAYVVGSTTNNLTFPSTPGAIRTVGPCSGPACSPAHVFVARIDVAGSDLIFSATLGSAGSLDTSTERPAPGIAIDALGQAVVTGWTKGSDLPVLNPQQPRMASTAALRFSNNGSVQTPFAGPPGRLFVSLFRVADGTAYALATNGVVVRPFRSNDGGVTWTELPAPAGTVTDLTVDPNNSATLYTPAAKSTDGGLTWTPLGTPLDSAPRARPGSPGVLFAVAASFQIVKSVDGGASWTPSNSGISLSLPGRIVISLADPNVMYFQSSAETYGSTDGGATWTRRPVPADTNEWLEVNPSQPLTVYTVGFSGAWKSTDGGITWTQTLNRWVSRVLAASATVVFARDFLQIPYVSLDAGNSWTAIPDAAVVFLGRDATAADAALATIPNITSDGFVAALSPSGALLYESFLGGTKTDIAYGVAVTPDSGFVVVGATGSTDFPVANALQSANAGQVDAFVTKLRFPQPLLTVESPADTATVFAPFTLRGWTLDRGAAIDDGIDTIHVWALPSAGSAIFVAAVAPAIARADIAARFGPQFATSGFSVPVSGLAPGSYLLAVFPHSSVTDAFASPALVQVIVAKGDLITIETPTGGAIWASGGQLSGWAIDRAAAAGAGVSTVHVWGVPLNGQRPFFAGAAAYGLPRGDIAALYGSQFLSSGFSLTLPTLPPGPYQFLAFPFSTASNTFLAAASVQVTLAASRPNGSLDGPANGATVTGRVFVGGWAIDQSAPDTAGVDAVHVYAAPLAGGPPIFLGAAQYGFRRDDVAAIFGLRFAGSGYSLIGPALPPGMYQILAFSRSTVTGTFNLARTVIITVR